jgi:glyoxylase-like metal-dependent hydrolase (beta-lactamase superfamily II)
MLLSDDIHIFLWSDPSANNCNAYFIYGTKKILIDPGHHHLLEHVRRNLGVLSLSFEDIDVVIITHGHPDHLEGVRSFNGSSTLVVMHELELEFIKNEAPHYVESMGLKDFEPDILLKAGNLRIGDARFQIIHTPGHSPGSFCLYWPDRKALFTGDVVFNQGVGRTDLPGGDGQALKESIRTLSHLDVEHLLPGHGEPISGRDLVRSNFAEIERVWFDYL